MKKRSYSLDLLKFIACIGLLWFRYRKYTCPDGIYFGTVLIREDEWGLDLRFLVEIFFVLSGFFMFPYIEKIKYGISLEQFMIKRIIRIIPMLCISTILLEIMFIIMMRSGNTHGLDIYQPALFGIISACFGVEYGWGLVDAHINPESWYLDILLLCYLIFIIIIKLSKKTKIREKYFFILMIGIGAFCTLQEYSIPYLEAYNGRGYVAFFMGVLLASYLNRTELNYRHVTASFICLAIYGIYHVFGSHYLEYGKSFLIALFVAPALVVLLKTGIAEKIFAWKGWGELGKMSFSMYLIHVVVIIAIFNITDALGISIDYAHDVMLLAYIILVIFLGALTYYCVEKPITACLIKKSEKI